ncbi:MAG: cation:proton antiporter [Spirochaetales bacterium]|uniref:Cation:proton antiporter n=1 Tax=Candidatus Thalassospirochaeta sargassi TaxID=3119039 RepID=A0AAJ1I9V0_9SPIO|nr:cation:proton antiporter [Spirochaetales bacterium]
MVFNPGILLIFGISIFGGFTSSQMFKKIHIPQVIGYIAAGVIFGQTVLGIITPQVIDNLQPFNNFALGIIGFLVGSELLFSDMKKYGKQFSTILIGEGVLAFILVGSAVGFILYKVTGVFSLAMAGGVVFGAIASATDPASTINVLWEYRAAGILTTTIIAIVALDDALAMFLYGLGTSISQILTGGEADIAVELLKVAFELGASIILGIATGGLIALIIRKTKSPESLFVIAFGILLICIGLCAWLELDIILAGMFAGISLVNILPERGKEVVKQIRNISTPIYILFFALVGARLSLGSMPAWLWLIVAVYVVLRSFGKWFGAWIGARISGADKKVCNFTGMSLFAQGGVAIGLSIMASSHLSNISIQPGLSLGDVIIFGVTATTLIVQIIGPMLVKVSVKVAGEAGRNVTEEDVLSRNKVEQIVDRDATVVSPVTPIKEVVELFGAGERSFIPVVDNDNVFKGIIRFTDLTAAFLAPETLDWLVAGDFLYKTKTLLTPGQTQKDAINIMTHLHREYIPVVDNEHNRHWVGLADRQSMITSARRELLPA